MRVRIDLVVAVFVLAVSSSANAESSAVATAIAQIQAIGKEGDGNTKAAASWRTIVSAGGSALMPTLQGFVGASPTAANWLRTAVDAIVEGETKAGRKLPSTELLAFVKNAKQSPVARRIAYELYAKVDADAAKQLLPTFLSDESLELRYDAVAAEMERVQKLKGDAMKAEYAKILPLARDLEQVEKIAELLEKAGGTKVDLTSHFGFVTAWQVIGPFDGPDGGFTAVHPPEQTIDLKAKYKGKGDKGEIGWKYVQAAAVGEKLVGGMPQNKTSYGTVDLNAVYGQVKSAVVYAYAVVEVEKETPIDLRAATQNSIHIYLNGKKLFEREEYHHGTVLDQHVGRGTLKAGKNEILLKICQNDMKEPWAQVWTFQLRLSDHLGGPKPFKTVTPK